MQKHRLIAIHLPQFHPIPENDLWWGKGFTEWTNVAKAKPLFKGHYQPHIPSDMGFYDLRLAEAHIEQSNLAKQYGIHGFCYYHYWFNGKKLLEQPLELLLKAKGIDTPFMLCWANETWSRTWNGNEKNILIKQTYSFDDHLEHINYLADFFRDPRYIRIDNKPVFVFYKTSDIPDFKEVVALWRKEAQRIGIGELYLCQMQSRALDKDFKKLGLDAGIDFKPDWRDMPIRQKATFLGKVANKLGLKKDTKANCSVYSYEEAVKHYSNSQRENGVFPCVFPSWDNSPRKQKNATIFIDSSPKSYGKWLKETILQFKPLSEEENLVFVNAWNEWAEGNHLEPDIKNGRKYLEETANALGINTKE